MRMRGPSRVYQVRMRTEVEFKVQLHCYAFGVCHCASFIIFSSREEGKLMFASVSVVYIYIRTRVSGFHGVEGV